MLLSAPTIPDVKISLHDRTAIAGGYSRWRAYLNDHATRRPLSLEPGWLQVLERAMRYPVYALEAREGEQTRGLLLLAFAHSRLFGRFLVSLPYLNYGGVFADDDAIAGQLVDRAVSLADELDVRYLELRQQRPVAHPALSQTRTDKVNVHLELPATTEELWAQLSAKVRNQVRKAEKNNLTVAWGGCDLLGEFYRVFSRNMRDLGTPVYSKSLFRAILEQFSGQAEIAVARHGSLPIAAGLVLHGSGISEIPSASSLRRYNPLCANMLLYWHMLKRAIERRQTVFDFGRSSKDSPTLRFKEQWGARPIEAPWQYYLRHGNPHDARRDNPRFQRFIRIWQRLPVFVTRLLGPAIVRGIP